MKESGSRSGDEKGKAKAGDEQTHDKQPEVPPELPKGLEGFFQRYQQSKQRQQWSPKQSDTQNDEPPRAKPPPQGGSNNNFNPNQLALLVTSAVILYALSGSSGSQSREITWQEFRSAFLEKGLVERLIVVNRQKVRVKLHSNAAGSIYPSALGGGD